MSEFKDKQSFVAKTRSTVFKKELKVLERSPERIMQKFTKVNLRKTRKLN